MTSSHITPRQRLEKISTLMEAAVQQDEVLSQIYDAVQVENSDNDGMLLGNAYGPEKPVLAVLAGADVMGLSDDALRIAIDQKLQDLREWIMAGGDKGFGRQRKPRQKRRLAFA